MREMAARGRKRREGWWLRFQGRDKKETEGACGGWWRGG
jgi:hypothetical protein